MDKHQQLLYAPSGKKIILTEKTIRFLENEETMRIGECLVQEGGSFFSKDQSNVFHSMKYIYSMEEDI